MDFGIAGKRALVCASSKGLGLGCAEALAEAGVNLVMNARGCWMRRKALIFSSQTQVARRRGCGPTGPATISSRRSTPIC